MPGEFRPSLPGERRGGRQKGTPNKASADLKAMILGALSDVGGRDYLARQAVENPGPFMTLIGKVLPMQVTGDPERPLSIDFRWQSALEQPQQQALPEPEPADDAPITLNWAAD